MGTKSYFHNKGSKIEIYRETSEPVHVFGVFKGYNTYILIPNELIDEWKLKGDYFFIDLKEYDNFLPRKMKFWGGWIIEVSQDFECLCVSIKGGSKYESALIEEDYNFFKMGAK